MLFGLYLGTTASSFIIDFLASKKLKQKIKDYGYKKINREKTLEEKIANIGKFALSHLMPVLNVFESFYVLRTLNDSEKFEEYLIHAEENGDIEKIKNKDNYFISKDSSNDYTNKELFERVEIKKRYPLKISRPKTRIKTREE